MPTLKLRQDNVRTIPYQGHGGKHQCVYWDEALESFGLRVYPSGRRVYVCAYRINQRKRLATLGRADALSLDQARKKAMTYLAKAANQEDPQSNIDAQRRLKTIDELCEAHPVCQVRCTAVLLVDRFSERIVVVEVVQRPLASLRPHRSCRHGAGQTVCIDNVGRPHFAVKF